MAIKKNCISICIFMHFTPKKMWVPKLLVASLVS